VSLCVQQRLVIQTALPVSVGLISGSVAPEQWKDAALWRSVLNTYRVMVTTPQVLLDALRHGYIDMGKDIGLLVFDEAHHAVDKHPYNRIMVEFYFTCPRRVVPTTTDFTSCASENVRPMVLGLTASPIFGGNVGHAFGYVEICE
jgi:endoribonuclease Dicer